MFNFFVKLFVAIRLPRIFDFFARAFALSKASAIKDKQGNPLSIVFQGGYSFDIAGDTTKFEIDCTSKLKSGCFIECSGGVKIGRYFHCGRGLTIFSTNHNYHSPEAIPYDHKVIERPVTIGDFVWFGANVTVMPGVTVGEGAIVGGGTVLSKDVPAYSVVVGPQAVKVSERDIPKFMELKEQKAFLD